MPELRKVWWFSVRSASESSLRKAEASAKRIVTFLRNEPRSKLRLPLELDGRSL